MKNIQKPISIRYSEFISDLTQLINNSGLPAFVLESVLKDFYSDVKILSKRQLESDIAAFEAMNSSGCQKDGES